MERRNWTREELLVALKLYCELDFGQFHASNNRVIEVASLLGRTPGSIAMKLGNLASLDPAMHGKGLSSVSKADIKIMEEFLHDTERVVLEVEEATRRLLSSGQYTGFAEEAVAFEHENIAETERLSLVKTRTMQQFFRTAVLSSYRCSCAICQIKQEDLLVASHIVPWARNEKLRVTPDNGIALCALHDRAFDCGLIAIEDDYSLCLSKKLTEYKDSPPITQMFVSFSAKPIHLPFRFWPNKEHLAWHRENVFIG